MKHFAYLLLILISLSSCQTEEKRADKLIDRWMYENLHDYTSYEPLSTAIDSAYTCLYRDSAIIVNTYMLTIQLNKYEEIMSRVLDGYKALENFQRNPTQRAAALYREYYKDVAQEMQELLFNAHVGKIQEDSILVLVEKFVPRYIGKEVHHKYRAKSQNGEYAVQTRDFIMDDNYTKIIDVYNVDNDEEFRTVQILVDNLRDGQRCWGLDVDEFVTNDVLDRWKKIRVHIR